MFNEIKQRWNSDTPSFFKNIRNLSIKIGGSALAVWTANTAMSLNLNEVILTVCKYTIMVCAALGLNSQLTKTDK